jgi:iron complex outermembrane receptor protein
MMVRQSLSLAVACCFLSVAHADELLARGSLNSQETEAANVLLLAPSVVTATRIEQNSFDLPVSIDVVDAEQIQEGQLQVNISESLARVPGIVAQSRGQFAQDIQISSRGFGARSQFGVRGIRLYADGIPLTMPDGQGQAGTFDLGSAKNIEVMRGPFSALYGNSSGGVVQIFTESGPDEFTPSASFTAGSYGTTRESLKAGGTAGNLNYLADYSLYDSDGYRDHSEVRRKLFNARLGVDLSDSTKLVVIATDLDQPVAQDPLGLTKAQVQQNRRQADIKATTFNTRVERSHTQLGAKLEHNFNADDALSLMVYGGIRDNLQYQASGANTAGTGISSSFIKKLAANADNQTAGGVAQIDRDFGGTDLRYTHKGMFIDGPYSITVGANYDTMTDERKGYDNFINISGNSSNTTCGVGIICGVKGYLRRDEDNIARNFDQYAQLEWSPQQRWNLIAGARHSDVTLSNKDHYLWNGNSSGSVEFTKTTPIVGAVFKLTPAVNLYANVGKGFETPTLIEMAYKPGGIGSFNTDLKPATSTNYEMGTKAFLGANTRVTLAIFKTDTQNEIVVADNTNGRSSYQNASGTERKGVELSLDSDLGSGLAAFASYAYLDAQYSEGFCSGKVAASQAACTGAGSWVSSGKTIPGTYRQTAYAEIRWKHTPTGFTAALETHAMSKVYVSDTRNDAAQGYALVNWRAGFEQNLHHWRVAEFLRIENIFDRDYIGSVKLNDSNSQFYEPGAGRNWLLGLNASYRF